MTDYRRPRTLAEALALRAQFPDYLLLAGGTDLMVQLRGASPPPGVIDLFALPELCGVRPDSDQLWIGSATTYQDLYLAEQAQDLDMGY